MPDDAYPHPSLVPLLRSLFDACGGDDSRLFVLLDACRIRGLSTFLKEVDVAHVSLYRGAAETDLAQQAPYLAELRLRSDLIPWIFMERSVGEAALIAVADAGLEELRKHFRRFLIVIDTLDRETFFRFYDPRVIAPFLSASTQEEKARFFGPVRSLRACLKLPPVTEPMFTVWNRPEIRSRQTPPDAGDKFRMRPEHDTAFSKDMWRRYEDRCVAHLRSHHADRVGKQPEGELRALVGRANHVAGMLQIPAGRDVTRIAEAMVLGMTAADADAIAVLPVGRRSAAVAELHDRLKSTPAAPPAGSR